MGVVALVDPGLRAGEIEANVGLHRADQRPHRAVQVSGDQVEGVVPGQTLIAGVIKRGLPVLLHGTAAVGSAGVVFVDLVEVANTLQDVGGVVEGGSAGLLHLSLGHIAVDLGEPVAVVHRITALREHGIGPSLLPLPLGVGGAVALAVDRLILDDASVGGSLLAADRRAADQVAAPSPGLIIVSVLEQLLCGAVALEPLQSHRCGLPTVTLRSTMGSVDANLSIAVGAGVLMSFLLIAHCAPSEENATVHPIIAI